MLTFSVLGPLEVRRDGGLVDLGRRRHTELLSLLATRPRAVVPAEALADQLWDGAPPASATNTLQGLVSGLRRVLEPERGPRDPARVLVTHPVGYLLDVEDEAVDVMVFRARVAEARRLAGIEDRQGEAVASARAALGLWRGAALADVADRAWAQPVVQALEEERLAAVELLAELRLAGDDVEDLVAGLRSHLASHPLRERAAAQLMRALYRTGRQAEALEVARVTRATLDDQLGIDPGPELRDLELAILRHDDDVLVPRPVASRKEAPPAAATTARLPGRDAELAVLATAGAGARSGVPTVALVTGEAGIGKTRLVHEATTALAGFEVVVGRCSDLEGTPPYWPWRQVVALLAPADGSPVGAEDLGGTGDTGVDAGRFEQAVRLARRLRSAAAERPVALVLDDLQWADAPSLQLLELVLAELGAARVLVVLTSRVVGAGSPPALVRLVAALGRHPSSVRIELVGLATEALATCVAEVTGRHPEPAAVEEVQRRSGGNPFFARELARLLDEEDRLADRVPDAVRDVIRMRSSALGSAARERLAAGAVIGRDFAVATVRDMLGTDPAAFVPVVEEALAAGLLVEPVPGRLRFEHALVHEAVREDLSGARALTLHARAAESLSRREQPPPGVLAFHLLHALDRRCFEVAARAAEQDLAQLAAEPALQLLDHALEISALVPAPPGQLRELRLLRGLALSRLGRLDEGERELARVAEEAEAARDPDRLARAALGMAADGAVSSYWATMAPITTGADVVVSWLRRALTGDAELEPRTSVALRSALATRLAVMGQPDAGLAESAARDSEGLDRRSRIRALTARWATSWTPEQAPARLEIAGTLLELAGGDIAQQLAGRHLLATALLEVGDLAGSDAQMAAVADTVRRHRTPDFGLLVVWWRAMRALMAGDLSAAEQAAQELSGELGDVTGRAAATAMVSAQTVAGMAAWERGLLGNAADQLDAQDVNDHPGMQAVRALAHANNDDPAGALAVLREAFGPRLERLGSDSTALSPLVLGAETLARAGDGGQASFFLERLAPYAEAVIVFAPGAVCMGAGTLYTGSMAALTGDLHRARRDLQDAVGRNDALGADPFTMRALSRLSAVEARLGAPDVASERLREAQAIARRRGLTLTPFAP